jgi:hypothetical protein
VEQGDDAAFAHGGHVEAMDVMREGHDGSGVGLFLRDLAGPFEEMKDAPILSGIFTEAGHQAPGPLHDGQGFMTKYKISIKVPKMPPPGTPRRDVYLIRAYEYPEGGRGQPHQSCGSAWCNIRLQLRAMGEERGGHDRLLLLARCDHDQGDRRPHEVAAT